MSTPKLCTDCGKALGQRNVSGFCRRCLGRNASKMPGWREKQREAIRRGFAENPERREAYAERARKLKDLPGLKERRRERWVAGRFWEKGNECQPAGSESRRKAGARARASRLAHIPPHLRDEYVALSRTHLPAEERARIVVEQEEADMRRFRQSIGIADSEPRERRVSRAGRNGAWPDCPEHLRADYTLMLSKGFTAAEARAMLEGQAA